MSNLFAEAMQEQKKEILTDLERTIWERIEPRIHQALHARHMTVREAAEYLHCSDATVRRLLRERAVPSFRVRGLILVRQMDVDRWVEAQIREGGGG